MFEFSWLQLAGSVFAGLVAVGGFLFLYGRRYPQDMVACNPEYERPRLPVRAVVAVYYLESLTLAYYIDGLSVDFDSGTWSFCRRSFILGQGAPFDLPNVGRVGVIVLDGDNPLVGYGRDGEGDMSELAYELAKEAASKGCHVPIGRLSVYHSPQLFPGRQEV